MKLTRKLIFTFVLVFTFVMSAYGQDMEYQESPMLTERVDAGVLPPVAERLPDNPLVVNGDVIAQEGTVPNWQPGEYGGTLRVLHNEPNNAPDVFFIVFQQLIRPPSIISGQEPVNNIVEDTQISEDNRMFTFTLRKGLKWSDGEPVTTADLLFTYEDVLLNEELYPATPNWATHNGNIFNLEVVDEYTFTLSFDDPNGSFTRALAINNWPDYSQILKPKHYLQQFHIDYTSLEDMQPMLDEEGFGDEWTQLFLLKDAYQRQITGRNSLGMPVLNPWVLTEIVEDTFIYERNPYYFKVDEEGQQLPYIDRIVSPKVQDGEMENLQAIAGEADVLRRNASLLNLPLYVENEERGEYNALVLDYHLSSPITFSINMTYGDDEVYQEVVQDHRFREAVSLAIDSQEIIDSVFFGWGHTPELIPAGFNMEESNRLLDEMGMTIGDDGFRTMPNGEPFNLLIEIGAASIDQIPAAELASAHLQEYASLNVSFRQLETSLMSERLGANEVQSTIFWSFDAMADDEETTRWLAFAGVAWDDWYNSGGESGTEPPEWVKQGIDLENQRLQLIYGSQNYFDHKALERQYYYDNIPTIHLIEGPQIPLILSQYLGNAPEDGFQISGLMLIEGMYFTSEERRQE